MSEPVELVELRRQKAVTTRRIVPDSGLGAFFGEVLPKLFAAANGQGAKPSGPWFARYYNSDRTAFDVEAGVPIDGAVKPTGDVKVVELPGGKAAKTVHIGRYDALGRAYRRIEAVVLRARPSARHGPLGVVRDRSQQHTRGAAPHRDLLAARLVRGEHEGLDHDRHDAGGTDDLTDVDVVEIA